MYKVLGTLPTALLQTIPKQRLEKYIGTLDDTLMKTISERVVLALNLEDAFSTL